MVRVLRKEDVFTDRLDRHVLLTNLEAGMYVQIILHIAESLASTNFPICDQVDYFSYHL